MAVVLEPDRHQIQRSELRTQDVIPSTGFCLDFAVVGTPSGVPVSLTFRNDLIQTSFLKK
jgi:hypothetical protein